MIEESSTAAALALAKAQVSFRSRIGHLALFLVGTGASVMLAALLATEDGLPSRTTAALAVVLVINLSWAAYAAWVLTAPRAMLFNHRVIAGRIAVVAAAACSAGTAAITASTQAPAAYAAAGSSLVLLAIAIVVLMRAKRDFNALRVRRSELEARLLEIAR